MNSINKKVKNKIINSYSKKYLISSIESIVHKCTILHVSLSECIHAIGPILSEENRLEMNRKFEKENIGLFQKGLETSIQAISEMNAVESYTQWTAFTNEICFSVINIHNCISNLENLIGLLKGMNLLELNAFNFSEAKMMGLKSLKENAIHDTHHEIQWIYKQLEKVYELYIKYLKTMISIHTEWFQEKTFYRQFSKKVDDNHELIDLYTKTMKVMIFKVKKEMKEYIIQTNETLKDKMMNSYTPDDAIFEKENTQALTNTLQFFNIVSLENEGISLYDLCRKLFNIENTILHSIKETNYSNLSIPAMLQELINILNMVSTKKKMKYGMIIFYKNNHDIYTNISKLLKTESFENIQKYSGINKKYINLYNNLKEHLVIERVFNNDMCMNINIDKFTERAFVLHTNTMKTFRIQSNFKYSDLSIDYALIRNIVRNTPSKRIEYHNRLINQSIEKYVDNRLQRKYNDFVNMDYGNIIGIKEYQSLIQFLIKDITAYIQSKNIEKMTKNEFSTILVQDELYEYATNTIIQFYKREILPKKTTKNKQNKEVYITCLSESNKLIKRLKNDIIRAIRNKPIHATLFIETILPTIVKEIIKLDSENIYDKLVEKDYKVNQLAYV